jgi:MSHA biogenesis protein MshP
MTSLRTVQQKAQRGFAAIAAIFLVVVLAALGGFMLTFSNTQQLTAAQDVQGSRAYWAANAGLEWGLASLTLAPGACPVQPAPFVVDGFALAIVCVRNVYVEAGVDRVIYRLTSTATVGVVGTVSYIERSVSASMEI